jgi:hypothetical protein
MTSLDPILRNLLLMKRKKELRRALTGKTEQVTEWLDSFAEGSVHLGSFSNFSYMLEAVAEMTIWPDWCCARIADVVTSPL